MPAAPKAPDLMLCWKRIALRAARREAASRRYFRRIEHMKIAKNDAFLRRRKRGEHLDRDYQQARKLSIITAHAAGVDAEGWQDVYYRELERCGEKPPPGVAQRFANSNTGTS